MSSLSFSQQMLRDRAMNARRQSLTSEQRRQMIFAQAKADANRRDEERRLSGRYN